MNCPICQSKQILYLFNKFILNKYDVAYFECQECKAAFTDRPTWLEEAYTNAISAQDVGLVDRNIRLAKFTKVLIFFLYDNSGKYLDYGGGYGLFVRLMRDSGINFFRFDPLCSNVFAQGFDINDFIPKVKFELVTAFEVLEHFPDPIKGIQEILKFSNEILFSTEIRPQNKEELKNWWYLSTECGQHLNFYSIKSLNFLAKSLNCYLYSNGTNLHLFTKKRVNHQLFKLLSKVRVTNIFSSLNLNKKSLTMSDYQTFIHKSK